MSTQFKPFTQARARRFIQEWEHHALVELYNEYSYILRERKIKLRPAALEIYDSNSHWGQWVYETRTIRLSRRLLTTQPWFHVLGVLKHEMAHQMVDEGGDDSSTLGMHGEDFKKACEKLGLPLAFSKASLNLQEHALDWREEKHNETTERLLDKVRKLLALATSSNEYEALSAMNRVREIYARHNIEQFESQKVTDFVHIVITRNSRRLETYEKKIIGILVGHFFVQVIAGQVYDVASGNRYRSIEIIGTRESALMAEYVYHFLLQQSEYLVEQASKQQGKTLSRVVKKSYRLGILTGFSQKLEMQERSQASVSVTETQRESMLSKALVLFEKDQQLDRYISKVYPRLRTLTSARQRLDSSAYQQGQTVGRKITLNKPISTSSGDLGKLLSRKR